MALPILTAEQRAEALEKAAQARRIRATVKVNLKQRKISLNQVFDQANEEEAIGKMKVISLLQSLPRVGTTTAALIMTEIGIAESRRIRGLGTRQRTELMARFA